MHEFTPRRERFRRRLKSFVDVTSQSFGHERFQTRIHRPFESFRNTSRRLLALHLDHHEHVLRHVRQLARERLVDERRARVDVRAMIHRLRFADLLRRHERERSQALTHLRQSFSFHTLGQFGDAEVQDFYARRTIGTLFQKNVRRLEVAMDDAHTMRVGQTHPHLLDDRMQLFECDRARTLQAIDETFAFEQFEDEHDAEVRIVFDVEHLRHVVAVDRTRCSSLAAKALYGRRFRLRIRVKQLDRHPTSGAGVFRGKHFPHPTSPKRVADAVATCNDGPLLDLQRVRLEL